MVSLLALIFFFFQMGNPELHNCGEIKARLQFEGIFMQCTTTTDERMYRKVDSESHFTVC